jgi:hypothetical protein
MERQIVYFLGKGVGEVWHIHRWRDQNNSEDFAVIACDDGTGIVMPGRFETREPTCPDCLARAKEQAER